MSIIIGAVLMLVVQYYAFVKFMNLPENDERRKTLEEKYNLPEVSFSFLYYSYTVIFKSYIYAFNFVVLYYVVKL